MRKTSMLSAGSRSSLLLRVLLVMAASLVAREASAVDFAEPATAFAVKVGVPSGALPCVIDPETENAPGACDGIDVAAVKAGYGTSPGIQPLGFVVFRVGSNVLGAHAGWQPSDFADGIYARDFLEKAADGIRTKVLEQGATSVSTEIKRIHQRDVLVLSMAPPQAPSALVRTCTIRGRGGMVHLGFMASDVSAREDLDRLMEATLSTLTIAQGTSDPPDDRAASDDSIARRVEAGLTKVLICCVLAAFTIYLGRRLIRR